MFVDGGRRVTPLSAELQISFTSGNEDRMAFKLLPASRDFPRVRVHCADLRNSEESLVDQSRTQMQTEEGSCFDRFLVYNSGVLFCTVVVTSKSLK